MMTDEQVAVLSIAARILAYPDETFATYEKVMNEVLEENIQSPELKYRLKLSYKPLFELTSGDLQELYVATFDLKANLGLYLTAHELGDSTMRGAALIRLQKIINQAGFEREGQELADYIPMLLELLAVAPETPEMERLYRRLAVALQRMLDHIEETNPYAGILHILMYYVFPQPTEEEIMKLESGREEADLEELPFPIMYQ